MDWNWLLSSNHHVVVHLPFIFYSCSSPSDSLVSLSYSLGNSSANFFIEVRYWRKVQVNKTKVRIIYRMMFPNKRMCLLIIFLKVDMRGKWLLQFAFFKFISNFVKIAKCIEKSSLHTSLLRYNFLTIFNSHRRLYI